MGDGVEYMQIVRPEQAQQQDAVSCGILMLLNADRFIHNRGPVRELLPGHVRTLRRRYVQMFYEPRYFEQQLAALTPVASQHARAGGVIHEPAPTLAREAGSDGQPTAESARVPTCTTVETPHLVCACARAHMDK
jgi:hypothetical protein